MNNTGSVEDKVILKQSIILTTYMIGCTGWWVMIGCAVWWVTGAVT